MPVETRGSKNQCPETTSGVPEEEAVSQLFEDGIATPRITERSDSNTVKQSGRAVVVSQPTQKDDKATPQAPTSRSSISPTMDEARVLSAKAAYARKLFEQERAVLQLELEAEIASIQGKSCQATSQTASSIRSQRAAENIEITSPRSRYPQFPSCQPNPSHPFQPLNSVSGSKQIHQDFVQPGWIPELVQALKGCHNEVNNETKIDLPTFAGDSPIQWLALKRAYFQSSRRYGASENLIRLNKALSGVARDAVHVLLVSAHDPEDIIKALDRRFGRPDEIVLNEIQNLRQLPSLNDGDDLSIFACRVRNCVEIVQLLERPEYLYSPELFHTTLQKLPTLLRTRWMDFAAANTYTATKLQLLAEFLEREVELHSQFGMSNIAYPSCNRNQNIRAASQFHSRKEYDGNSSIYPRLDTKKHENFSAQNCSFCKQSHNMTKCQKFLSLSVPDRWNFIKTNNICHRCLKRGPHSIQKCTAKESCNVDGCPFKHNRILHNTGFRSLSAHVDHYDENMQPPVGIAQANVQPSTCSHNTSGSHLLNCEVVKEVEPRETSAQSCSISSSVSLGRALLKVISVVVSGPFGEVNTFALLDDGSSGTFIDSSISTQIGAQGPVGSLTLDCVGGLSRKTNVQYVTFHIRGEHSEETHLICNARAVNGLGLSTQSIPRESIRNVPHFLDLADIVSYENAHPMIIIGIDNWHLLITKETRQGARHEPVACLTPLGWVAYGFADSKTRPIELVNNCTVKEQSVHSHAGFEMRGWASNDPATLSLIPKDLPLDTTSTSINVDLGSVPQTIRTLGLIWPHDCLALVDVSALEEWPSTCLKTIHLLKIPRYYNFEGKKVVDRELHVFCDASELAYVAVAYWCLISFHSTVKLAFIGSKTRVTPLKPSFIPRLELQGALVAARLGNTICEAHKFKPTKRVFWCDSMNVLGWVRSDARNFKAFVGNRIGEILDISEPSEWCWVPSEQNVADDATRLGTQSLTLESRWITGPGFLLTSDWPSEPAVNVSISAELKPEYCQSCHQINDHLSSRTRSSPTPVLPVAASAKRISSWLCLVRATALAHQFICMLLTRTLFKLGIQNSNQGFLAIFCQSGSVMTTPNLLNAFNLEIAEEHVLWQSQLDSYKDDYFTVKNKERLQRRSRIFNLSPTIGQDNIMRLNSRVTAVEGISEKTKFPIILDGARPATRLLIQKYHQKAAHGNTGMVVNEVHQFYWVLNLRSTVRSVSYNCQFCRLRKAYPLNPPMGNLPPARLGHGDIPFTFVGLDYFGPVDVTIGRSHGKRYVTCLVSRAVHLEIVHSLSTDSALMSLRRFIARRGCPREVHSDNGTAFVALSRELRKLYSEEVLSFAANEKIVWRFIPPAAPFMGGSWERLVKSVKSALKITLRQRAPSVEVFSTLLAEAEAIVNSRPLTHVSPDPNYPEALTPNHFLLGSSSGQSFPTFVTDENLVGRCNWRRAMRLADHFWRRWVSEYLPNLLPRRRSRAPETLAELKVGDVVLIADGSLPRGLWPRGRITDVFPGRDGTIRVVDVLTAAGLFRRPTKKVIPIVLT